MQAPPNFESRVDAIFGALRSPGQTKSWSLSQEQVLRTGKEAAYSSEEEEEANAAAARRDQQLPADELEGKTDEGGELPSNAFCRALDNEEEFDANDRLASGAFDNQQESLPSRHTPVLEDNFYERAAQARQERRERREGVDAMEVDPPAPSAAQEPAEAGTSAQKDDLAQDAPKRVRFAVPPTPACEDSDSALRSEAGGGGPGEQQITCALNSGRGGRRVYRGRGRRNVGGSFVPDHVKHPERYTAYVLDEPIVVGSGDAGSADKPADSEARDDSPDGGAPSHSVDLPLFGAGIAFNPQKKASKEPSQAAARVNQGGLIITEETAGGEEGITDEAETVPVADFLPKAKRERNLRSRS